MASEDSVIIELRKAHIRTTNLDSICLIGCLQRHLIVQEKIIWIWLGRLQETDRRITNLYVDFKLCYMAGYINIRESLFRCRLSSKYAFHIT